MLSSTFRRVLSHPDIFSIAQRLSTRAISNQCFAIAVQRNFTATASDRNSDFTVKPKSTLKSKKPVEKHVKKPKVTIKPEALPPKLPCNSYFLWLRDWISTQPKRETREEVKNTIRRGGQIWNELPENEKQQYQEKGRALRDEYSERMEEWRENVDPAILRELNRRRVARGIHRIRGPRRPKTGFMRYFQHVREENPRTEEDYQTYFKAVVRRTSSQWKAMSDAEKAKYIDAAKPDMTAWRERWNQAKA